MPGAITRLLDELLDLQSQLSRPAVRAYVREYEQGLLWLHWQESLSQWLWLPLRPCYCYGMACSVNLKGNITVGGDGCNGCSVGGSSSSKTQALSLACSGKTYGSVVSTDCAQQINATLGVDFVELPCSDGVGTFELLYVKTNARVVLRIGAAAATLLGVGGSFPTGFSGGETFTFTIDGVSVAVTFTAAAQSAQNVADEINQAAIGAGLTFLPATVDASGQVRLTGAATGGNTDGSEGFLAVTVANATIGFAVAGLGGGLVYGSGQDLDVNGVCLIQFESTVAPTRVQISGSAQVEVMVAGAAA